MARREMTPPQTLLKNKTKMVKQKRVVVKTTLVLKVRTKRKKRKNQMIKPPKNRLIIKNLRKAGNLINRLMINQRHRNQTSKNQKSKKSSIKSLLKMSLG